MRRDATDALFSKYIRLLANGDCERCGTHHGMKSQGLHCAHYTGTRPVNATRWYRDAARSLCYGCHQYIDTYQVVKDAFWLKMIGNDRFNKLIELKNTHIKLTKEDIKAIRADLRAKIKLLEDNR